MPASPASTAWSANRAFKKAARKREPVSCAASGNAASETCLSGWERRPEKATLHDLQLWSDRVLDAVILEDFFA